MQQLREHGLLVWVAPQPALEVAERLPERVGVTGKSIESLPDGGEFVEYDADIWAVDHAPVIHHPRMSARHLAVGLHFRERGPPAEAAQPRPPRPHFARRSSAASRCASSAAPSQARRPRSLPAWRDERNTRNFVLALAPRGYNSGMRRFRVSLAQINPTVGDVEGNTRRIVDGIAQARALGADLVAFPELAITGYPPQDLLFKSAFIEANLAALRDVTKAARGLTTVVGFVDRRQDLFNAAAVIHDGTLAGVYHKQFLPNYGVFDENRYFQAGREASVFSVGSTCVAVNVCVDGWYPTGPITPQALAGAELIVTINGSPYHAGKARFRERMIATRAADDVVWLAFVNMVGGQDELVFDGASVIRSEERRGGK